MQRFSHFLVDLSPISYFTESETNLGDFMTFVSFVSTLSLVWETLDFFTADGILLLFKLTLFLKCASKVLCVCDNYYMNTNQNLYSSNMRYIERYIYL